MSLLIPRKTLLEIGRLHVTDENEEIELAQAGNHVFFRSPKRLLYSRTLDGTFPSFERVIPTDNPATARVDRKGLLEVISRVGLLTNETAKLATFAFTGSTLTVSTVNPNMGEASEDIAIEHEGPDVKIGLNHQYVQEFLQALESETVDFKLKDSATQALLQPGDGTAANSYQYVVMPMRLT